MAAGYKEIVSFEHGLAEEGAIVVKLWLHISPKEQLKRFESRAGDPLKAWKLTPDDWENRAKRDASTWRRSRRCSIAPTATRPLAPDLGRVQALCPGPGGPHRRRGNRGRDAALGTGAAAAALESGIRSAIDHEEPYPLSRFRIFALLAALAALATVFAACGGSSKSSEDPQKVIDNASLEGVKSGNLDLSLAVKSEGDEGGNLDVELSGPFQSGSEGNLPQFALTARAKGTAKGEDIDFEGGLTLLSDRAYVNYKGTEYEVDPTTFGFVKSGFEQAEQEGGSEEANGADVTACQEAATGLKVGDFVDNLSNEGSAEVDGTSTTKVSGDLNTGAAIDALIKLTENPACSAQLEAAGPLPIGELEKAKGELTTAVKKAHVDVYVGDDDIIRKLAAEMTIEPKGSGDEKVEVESRTLARRRQRRTGDQPRRPTRSRSKGLFQKLGVNPIELLEGASSGEGLGSLLEGSPAAAPPPAEAPPPAAREARRCRWPAGLPRMPQGPKRRPTCRSARAGRVAADASGSSQRASPRRRPSPFRIR